MHDSLHSSVQCILNHTFCKLSHHTFACLVDAPLECIVYAPLRDAHRHYTQIFIRKVTSFLHHLFLIPNDRFTLVMIRLLISSKWLRPGRSLLVQSYVCRLLCMGWSKPATSGGSGGVGLAMETMFRYTLRGRCVVILGSIYIRPLIIIVAF